MNCATVRRKMSRSLDGECSKKEQQAIAQHVSHCSYCAAEQKDLAALQELFLRIPAIHPSAYAEQRFWNQVNASRDELFLEKVRSLILQWSIVPARYAGAIILLAGMLVGLGSGTAYHLTTGDKHPAREAVEYFALGRMATIPEQSLAGVYHDALSERGGMP